MKIQDIQTKFAALQARFDQLYEDTVDDISVSDKVLKEALSTQVDLQLQWGMFGKNLSHLHDICEMEVEAAYATAVGREMKDGYKSVNISEAKEYAKADADYKAAKRLLIDIRQLRDNTREINEAIISRKYVLNNITGAVIASAENHMI
jgi:hypothetical protein